ncbi:MAG: RidA family protein [Bauldia sp.]|nr:RidA family protein [Bauldia sp.]
MPVERINPEGIHRNSAYSQMVILPAGVRTAIIGGQNAVDKDGNVVGKGDIARQTEQALRNLVTCLAAVDAGVEDLVQVRIYILAGQDLKPAFGAWMEVWGQRLNPPAVTGVFVAGLAHPDYLIEIEATAALPG